MYVVTNEQGHSLSPRSRHRCPHRPQRDIMNQSDQDCVLSEYTQKFSPYTDSRPRESLKPPPKALAHDAKMECSTTNRLDFVSHTVSAHAPKPPVDYKQPEGNVDSTTEYKVQFLGKWADPRRIIRPSMAKRDDSTAFDHKSTQARDFVKVPIPQREIHGPKYIYEPTKDPFDASSTVKADFVDFGRVELTSSLKPRQEAKITAEPFDSKSCYRTTFTVPAMPVRFQRAKEVFTPSPNKLDSMTTFKANYPGHTGIKPAGCLKPPQKSLETDVRFDGNTVSRLSYRSWDLPTKFTRPPTVFVPPTEKLLTRSTFREDFPDYGPIAPPKSLRPPANRPDNVPPLESLTTKSIDYKVWKDAERPSAIRREKKYEPPSEQFDAVSTFQSHFKGEFGSRALTARPPETKVNTRDNKMESDTMYKDSYSRGSYKACPASRLNAPVSPANSGYRFSFSDGETGHKYFSPLEKPEGVVVDPVST